MFDSSKVGANRASQDTPYNGASLPEISHLNQEELVTLYDLVSSRLPPMKLAHLNMEEELVLQLYRAKALQTKSMEDDNIPANQKAQVMNSVASVIGDLIRLQERLFNAERFKAIEAILLESLKMLPKAQTEAFIIEYAKLGSTID